MAAAHPSISKYRKNYYIKIRGYYNYKKYDSFLLSCPEVSWITNTGIT